MALEIVGWFVSAVLSGLVNTSLEYFKKQTGLKDEVEKLKLCIPKIESVVFEAEKRQIADNPGLKKWLWNLKVALFEAEDVLDELEDLRIEKEASSSKDRVHPNKKIKFTWEKEEASSSNSSQKLAERAKRFLNLDPTLKKLKAVVEKLNKIGNDLDPFLKLVHKQPLISNVSSSHNHQRSRGPCLSKQTPIFGREEEKEELINQLLCLQSSRMEVQRNVNKVGVSVIVGEGGLGKTTLAQLVCNDDKVKQHFKPENIWWVTVSDDFVLDLLAKKIFNAVFDCEPSVNGFDFIQKKLKTELEPRTFLLVLDDVWDDMKRASWSQVISLLEHGKHGSKILVTTRFESVARMVKTTSDPIRLTRLKEEAYWELLKEVCLPDPEDQAKHPELLEIGKKIAKKLNGSPLAAKVVGGMLNNKLDERYWNSIYETDMRNFDGIMSVLNMSYQHLPTYLQPLFRYCSIFPPDYLFNKERLIYMWVGAGLILQEKDQEQDVEDLGSCYFEDLLRRSFFIFKENFNRYVMHDLLHELARDVCDGECCRVSGDIPIPITTQHLSVETAELLENKHLFEKMSQLKHLRTLRLPFHFGPASRETLINKLLETLTSIRVLELPNYYQTLTSIREQSTWINKLIHLRYLHAYRVSIASLGRLHLLQFLISSDGPTEMSAEHLFLPHLRHFTYGLSFLTQLGAPRNLTMLRELRFCLKKERGYKISELRNLVHLRYLEITGLENVSRSEEAGEANMKGKHHLKELILKWNPNSNDELRMSEAVFDGLEPHVDLKKMRVYKYPGSRGPFWFQTYSFKSKLEEISIFSCPNWKDMSFLQHLPSLMELRIGDMRALERIGTPEVSRGCQLFPKLRLLKVSRCPMLKTLPPLSLGLKTLELDYMWSLTTLPERTVQDNENSWLSTMRIRNCPNLISLKEGLLQGNVKLKHLKEVKIVHCLKLVHLPDLLPTSLTEIYLRDCSSITSLDLFGLTSLKTLRILDCQALESVKGLENLASLTSVDIEKCPKLPRNLRYKHEYGGPEWHEISHIPHISFPSLQPNQLQNMDSELARACQTGDTELLLKLMQEDGNLLHNKCMPSLLQIAVKREHVDTVKLILKSRPELATVKDEMGDTVLHIAAKSESVDMVRLILESIPSLRLAIERSDEGETALQIAIEQEKVDMVREILKWRPELVISRNNRQETALHIASRKGNLEMVRIIYEATMVKSEWEWYKDVDGRTPLHLAVINGKLNIIKELLSISPQSIQILTDEGENLLHLALKNNQLDCLEYFISDCDVSNLVTRTVP